MDELILAIITIIILIAVFFITYVINKRIKVDNKIDCSTCNNVSCQHKRDY